MHIRAIPKHGLVLSALLLYSYAVFAQTHPGTSQAQAATPAAGKLALKGGWSLQSSGKVPDGGEIISTVPYQPKNWYSVTVPTTVVAALVKDKVYPDPAFGMNLRQIPGVSYPIGANFSNLAMEPDSPFAVSWWYRKAFRLPASYRGKTIWLNFQGINYRANIWVNGQKISDLEQVGRAWRTYEFDISRVAHAGAENVVAVQVFAPTESDLAITFVD